MNFNQTIQYRALRFKAHVDGSPYNAQIMEDLLDEEAKKAETIKTVCAPISIQLFDRLNNTLDMLDISKRQFIELALIEALDRADKIISEVDIFENCPEATRPETLEQDKS